MRTTEEVLHCTTAIETTPLKYARKLKQESIWRCVSRTCSKKLFVKTNSSRAENDPGCYTPRNQQEWQDRELSEAHLV